ncbi:protein-tyrosine phosphatase [Alteribacillus persepolensis]|uniref:Protein-tyrosine phosphatase n=1 Tax=Alteribacillus persepolensis TaxID=568899 RepID=A0A1G8HCK9_9BACI|nr:low molecular weight protein arginine phosphatase [Alteribacillus persepolensis]SDI04396.1 protein-tyrosine phosphatase [Alteribacillus persepolensis]
MTNVLFVCTGNTCRSPMAEALFRAKGMEEVQARSAGIYAAQGMPASEGAKTVLHERQIAFGHASQPLTDELIDWADIILTMTKSHRDIVHQTHPKAMDKAFTLREFAWDDKYGADIADPIGGTDETYRACADEIDELLDQVMKKLKQW